jgi:hypothetical protein
MADDDKAGHAIGAPCSRFNELRLDPERESDRSKAAPLSSDRHARS